MDPVGKRESESRRPVTDSVRIEFGDDIDRATLRALHAQPTIEQFPESVSALLQAAGVVRLTEVHRVSEGEIENDQYGFAREFVGHIRPGGDANAAVAILGKSPLIRRARPLLLRGAGDDSAGSTV